MKEQKGLNYYFCDLKERKELEAPLGDGEKATLERIYARISSFQDAGEILDFLFNETQDLLSSDLMALAVLIDDGARISLEAVVTDRETHYVRTGSVFTIQGTILETVLETEEPLIISDMTHFVHEYSDHRLAKLMSDDGIRSVLTFPLIVNNRPVGFLFRTSRQEHAYTMRNIRTCRKALDRIAQSVEKVFIIKELSSTLNAYLETLSFITHELKSPLDSIVSLGQTLTGGYLGDLQEKQLDYIQRIVKRAQYLKEMSSEYLTLARFESGEVSLSKKKTDFEKDILNESIELVQPQADTRKITITSEVPESLDPVSCDSSLIRIVTGNLLSNAVKYNHDNGEIRITVKDNSERILMEVWNTGPGFTEQEKEKLFLKFSRLESTGGKGHGIGLYSSWRIVRLHGGKIWATAKKGEWAKFSFTLPRHS